MGNLNIAKSLVVFAIFALLPPLLSVEVRAQTQELTSTNYKIIDPNVTSGGGAGDSTNYSLLTSVGNPTGDARLTSGTYAIGSGFPSGIQANVPLVRCAEASTNSGTTACANFPNANGAVGECGQPGCYDRIKLEIDHQNNPTDSLYLVSILDTGTSTQYYLQSTHTLGTVYDINDYMTICQIEGKDTRSGSGCAINTDPLWDASLQSTNVYGLRSNATYTISVRALNGDFTETQFSPTTNVTTRLPTLGLDIDIGTTSAASTTAPHTVDLGVLTQGTVKTATNQIWLDIDANLVNGVSTYVKDLNTGLLAGSNTIPSQSEDLAVDSGNDGGYGLQAGTVTQTSLGPLQKDSFYNLASQNVGQITTSNQLIFYTNTSGGNKGQLAGGRAGIAVKALAKIATPTGNYSDTITFTLTGTP